MKGAYVKGMQGWSLANAIEGTAPGGVSDESAEPPPSKCRWTGCGTILSIRNRPTKVSKKPSGTGPDIPENREVLGLLVRAEAAGHETGLAEAVASGTRRSIRHADQPDDEGLCTLHWRKTHDWHQGWSEERPAHYPPEAVEDGSARKKKA